MSFVVLNCQVVEWVDIFANPFSNNNNYNDNNNNNDNNINNNNNDNNINNDNNNNNYNYINNLEVKGLLKRRLIPRISNFLKNLSSGFKIIR